MQPYSLTLDKFIDHAAKWHGSTEVVTGGEGGGTRIGYAALRERANRLSGAFAALGLGAGDNLATLAWNSQAHMECWYGAMGTGIVCHTLNPRLASAHLAAMIHQAQNRVLAVSPGLAPLVEDLLARCPGIEHVVLFDEPGPAKRGDCSGTVFVGEAVCPQMLLDFALGPVPVPECAQGAPHRLFGHGGWRRLRLARLGLSSRRERPPPARPPPPPPRAVLREAAGPR